MMINPESYRKGFEDKSLDDILHERDRIIDFMKDFKNGKLPLEYYMRDPSAEVVYLTNISYLKEICDLITIKIDELESKSVVEFRIIDEMLSQLDKKEQDEFLDSLKTKDNKLYDDYMDWKNNED